MRSIVARASCPVLELLGKTYYRARCRFYIYLLRLIPAMKNLLHCVIFDCGAPLDDSFTEQHWAQAAWKLILAATVENRKVWPPSNVVININDLKRQLLVGAKLIAPRLKDSLSSFHDFKWQTQCEPPVPVLCITSRTDVVVSESTVRKYAQALQATHPSRHVSVRCLPAGVHGHLLRDEPEQYAAAINSFLEEFNPELNEANNC